MDSQNSLKQGISPPTTPRSPPIRQPLDTSSTKATSTNRSSNSASSSIMSSSSAPTPSQSGASSLDYDSTLAGDLSRFHIHPIGDNSTPVSNQPVCSIKYGSTRNYSSPAGRLDGSPSSPRNIPLPSSVPSTIGSLQPSTPVSSDTSQFRFGEDDLPFQFTINTTGYHTPNPFISRSGIRTPESEPSRGPGLLRPPHSEPSDNLSRSANSSFISSTASSPTPLGRSNHRSFSAGSTTRSLHNAFAGLEFNTPLENRASAPSGEGTFPPSENNGTTKLREKYRYSAVNNEQLPIDHVGPLLRRRLNDGVKVAESIVNVLQPSRVTQELDPQLNTILQTAKELACFRAQPERKVGVVGNTGAGKSSLINALLDEEGIAKAAGSGHAVTSYVTEYRYPRPEHGTGRALEVEYLHGLELDQELAQLLDDYRAPFSPSALSSEVSADEMVELERNSEAARLSLEQSLSRHADRDIELLKSDSYEHALSCVKRWARMIEWPDDVSHGRYSATARDFPHLRQLLDTYVPDSLLAFVKTVRVYVPAQVLQNGLIIADLPGKSVPITSLDTSERGKGANLFVGFNDINYARVQTAKRYISRCDEIFIVTRTTRAVDERSVYDIIREHVLGPEVGGRKATPNANIICTHAAAFSKDELGKWSQNVNQREFEQVEHEIDTMMKGEWVNYHQLKTAKIKRLSLVVKARNRSIKAKLQAKYADQALNLNIFFTDVYSYFDPINEQQIDVTGIPELRKFCYAIRLNAIQAAVSNFLNNALPSLIYSLEVWFDAATKADSHITHKPVDTINIQEKIAHFRRVWAESLQRVREETISKTFRLGHYSFQQAGVEACETWESFHHSSYRAWCAHNGTHTTEKQGYRCWNSELIDEMTSTLEESWETLFGVAESGFGCWTKEIKDAIEEISHKLRDADAPESLLDLLRARKRTIQASIEERREQYMSALGHIHRDASTGNSTSLIVKQMRPAYLKCIADSGRGVDERRKKLIYGHVSHGGIYRSMYRDITSAMESLDESTRSQLASDIEAIKEKIEVDLSSFQTVDRTLAEKDPNLFDELKRILPWARSFIEQLDLADGDR
ncbi:hypothetical protein FQN57_004932 [Myotisia sp. PD_48]|nr:hypothetical protein FQN57_004932 [Myotisia sp. PD_48]